MNDAAPAGLVDVGELDRRVYIGSSDIAAILGMGRRVNRPDGSVHQRTAYTVYHAKRGELEGKMDEETKRFLRRRKRYEGPVIEHLKEEFDGNIIAENRRYIDPEYSYMAAEIDWEWVDEDGVIQNGETKTVGERVFNERFGWGEPGTGDIPIDYACQVSYGLMVTGRQRCIVAALVGFDNMLFYEIRRDEEFIAQIREAARWFWTQHVLKGIPPDPQTIMDVNHAALKLRGRPVQLDEIHASKLGRLDELRAQAKSLKEEQEALAFDLGDFVCKAWGAPNPYFPPHDDRSLDQKKKCPDVMQDAGLYFDGRRIGSWNKQTTHYLDQKRLKEDKPEIVAAYQNDVEFRVIRVNKSKR